MSTLGQLYRQARALHAARTAQAMREEHPSYQLLKELDELKLIMDGLLKAYKDAGGAQAPRV